MSSHTDKIDVAIALWQKERPDLSTQGKTIVGRIIYLQNIILEAVNTAFKPLKLNAGEYAVLCTLRVSGAPFTLSPSQLLKLLLLSSGGLSNLLERMEKKELIKRMADSQDRRAVAVMLMPKGKKLVDKAMEIHTEIEQSFSKKLNHAEQKQLASLLKKLIA